MRLEPSSLFGVGQLELVAELVHLASFAEQPSVVVVEGSCCIGVVASSGPSFVGACLELVVGPGVVVRIAVVVASCALGFAC